MQWHALQIPHPDILTLEGTSSAQAIIYQTIYQLKHRSDAPVLHLDLTGGRKTMSAYMMFAAQLFCDDRDALWHVSASPEFTASKQWYPQKQDDVNLLSIPFIQLDLLVKTIQEYISPKLDLSNPAPVLEKSVEVLEDLALLGLMARGIDHEANNDLNDLMHRLRRIRRKLPVDSPLQQEIEHIQEEIQDLRGMLRSFVAIGESERMGVEFEPVRLRTLVSDVLRALSEIYDLYEVRLEGPDVQIHGDALLLKRLFRIVLANVKKHAKCRQVQIRFRQNPREATVTINDDGIGMSPVQVQEAFALFKPHPSLHSGKRVGLVVARRIARLHGGDLQLESQPDRGTTVCFRCPLSPFQRMVDP